MAGSKVTCLDRNDRSFTSKISQYAYHNAAFLPPNTLYSLPNPAPSNLLLPYALHTQLRPQLEVVKVVGVPPAYPPIPMANPPPLLLHMWLLLAISTYQVGNNRPAWLCSSTLKLVLYPFLGSNFWKSAEMACLAAVCHKKLTFVLNFLFLLDLFLHRYTQICFGNLSPCVGIVSII